MAKQPNQLPRELKKLEAKEIDPSLLHVRELRGRNVNGEPNLPHNKQPPTGPKSKRSIINDPTTASNKTPPFIPQGDLEARSPVPIQSSSELATDQGDMIGETIKQVTQKLGHTILSSKIGIQPSPSKSKKSPFQQPN